MFDLVFHWLDMSFSPLEFIWIIGGGGICILSFSFFQFALWKMNHRKQDRPEPDDHPLEYSSQLSSFCVNTVFCKSERGIFRDFTHYANSNNSLRLLRYVDMQSYAVFVGFFGASLYVAYYTDQDDGGHPSWQLIATGYDYFTDRMNFFAFIFNFCCPLGILLRYSIGTRNDMLEKAELTNNPKVNAAAVQENNHKLQCIPLCDRSYIGVISVFLLFGERLAFFLVFENIGIFSDEVQKWEYYAIAAGMIAAFHIYLVCHTLRRRIEWYDALPPANDAFPTPTDDTVVESAPLVENNETRKDRRSGIPLGHDFFFSTTQLLSASLFARAVFGAFVLGFAHGPEHRGIPIFLEFLTCIVIICSSRYLVFSDYVILDLMSYSDTLTQWRQTLQQDMVPPVDKTMMQPFITANPRKNEIDCLADGVREGVTTIVMNNVFATERPIY